MLVLPSRIGPYECTKAVDILLENRRIGFETVPIAALPESAMNFGRSTNTHNDTPLNAHISGAFNPLSYACYIARGPNMVGLAYFAEFIIQLHQTSATTKYDSSFIGGASRTSHVRANIAGHCDASSAVYTSCCTLTQ